MKELLTTTVTKATPVRTGGRATPTERHIELLRVWGLDEEVFRVVETSYAYEGPGYIACKGSFKSRASPPAPHK